MAQSPAVRPIDPAALRHVARRLAAAPGAPWLHGEVGRRMAERLPLIRLAPRRIVDWWSFTGGAAGALQALYPKAERIAVEPSLELVARSREAASAPWWSARRWSGGGAQVVLEEHCEVRDAQLVWCNMMLQAAIDPPAVFARWLQLLAVDGVVMFSCFGPDTVRQLTALYADCGWPAPTIPFVDLHDLGDMLIDAGFAEPVMDQETITLTWPSPAGALDELRALGGNLAPGRRHGLATARWRDALHKAMERSLDDGQGRIRLSFEITYGHAFKPPPRVAAASETTISLDRMRDLVKTLRDRPRHK